MQAQVTLQGYATFGFHTSFYNMCSVLAYKYKPTVISGWSNSLPLTFLQSIYENAHNRNVVIIIIMMMLPIATTVIWDQAGREANHHFHQNQW